MGQVAPWTRLQAIFKPSYKLNVLSKLKSQISLLNKSNVVYKLDCEDYEEFYIGQTTRRLKSAFRNIKPRNLALSTDTPSLLTINLILMVLSY